MTMEAWRLKVPSNFSVNCCSGMNVNQSAFIITIRILLSLKNQGRIVVLESKKHCEFILDVC
jgi:hypothetical protein